MHGVVLMRGSDESRFNATIQYSAVRGIIVEATA